MEYIGTINFNLVELSTWKATPVVDGYDKMSQRLKDIVEYMNKYKTLPSEHRSYCSSEFKKMMTEFVHKTSVGESVGLQSMENIKTLLDARNSHNANCSNTKEKETINIYEALQYVSKLREEMENTGKLTVQQICDIHRMLMTGLRDDAGEIRKHDVYTLCEHKGIHYYPEASIAEQILYACVDHHCIQMSHFASPSTANVEFIFKRAARLLFDFVDAHPFSDGNGRTCRLLANYVVSLITPFPVTPSCGEGNSTRDDYLKAIIECRDHRDKGPGALASMLIEDTWRGWRRLFQSISELTNG